MQYPDRLLEVTHSIHFNPNCPKPFQLHLLAPGFAMLDNITVQARTNDILGYGETIEEAAESALAEQDRLRREYRAKSRAA